MGERNFVPQERTIAGGSAINYRLQQVVIACNQGR
jgi:hypothetical protein